MPTGTTSIHGSSLGTATGLRSRILIVVLLAGGFRARPRTPVASPPPLPSSRSLDRSVWQHRARRDGAAHVHLLGVRACLAARGAPPRPSGSARRGMQP